LGVSYRPDNPFAQQYSPNNPFAKEEPVGPLGQVINAAKQVGSAFMHPIDSIVAIGRGIRDSAIDADAPVLGTMRGPTLDRFGLPIGSDPARETEIITEENTPNAVPLRRKTLGMVNTYANALLPGVGGAVTSRVANAALGAINDPEQPFRGATVGLVLGEAIHQGAKIIRLPARDPLNEALAATEVPEGSAPRLERRSVERPDPTAMTPEQRLSRRQALVQEQNILKATAEHPNDPADVPPLLARVERLGAEIAAIDAATPVPASAGAGLSKRANVLDPEPGAAPVEAKTGQSFEEFDKGVSEVVPDETPKPKKGSRRKSVKGAVNEKYRLDSDDTLINRAVELLQRIEEYSTGKHGAPLWVRDNLPATGRSDLSPHGSQTQGDYLTHPVSGETSIARRMRQDTALHEEVVTELRDRGWPEADLNDVINERWLKAPDLVQEMNAGLSIPPAARKVIGGAVDQVRGRPFEDAAAGIPDPVTRDAYRQVGESIDFGDRQAAAIAKSGRPTLFARIQHIADQIANGYGPIERLGERVQNVLRPSKNPRDLLSYSKSSEFTVKKAFDEGVIDAQTRKVVGPSYKSLFEPFKGDDAKIRQGLIYLKSKRDVGRGVEGVGGDQAKYDAALKVVEHGNTDPRMVAFAQRWEQYVDALGKYAVDSGLWTADFFKALKESDALYIPYKRLLGPSVKGGGGGAMTAGGDRLVNIGHGVKRFFGSKQSISNPALAMAEYTSAIIRRADSYRVGASLFDAVEALGPDGEGVLTPIKGGADRSARANAAAARAKAAGVPTAVMQELIDAFELKPDGRNPVIWRNGPNGERQYALVNSPSLWQAVSHLNAIEHSAVRDFLNVTLKPLKRVFTATTTGLVPRFSLAMNPIRDVVDAFAKSRAGITPKDIGAGYYESLKDIFSRSTMAGEAEAAGMGGVSMYFGEATPKSVARQFAPTTPIDRIISNAHWTATRPLRALEVLGEASDKGPRLGEYMASLRKNQHRVDSGEWTDADLKLRAASEGRPVTLDFSNRPGNHVLRFFGDYVPFFNVALQAPIQFGMAAVRNPKRLIGASAGVAGAAALAWGMKHALSPDVRQQINDRQSTERAGFILVPIDQKGNLLRFPLGQEMGIVASAVTAGLDAAMESDPHAGRLLAASFLRALPPGIGELLQANPTIPIPGIQQMLENAKNRRDYGGHPIVPKRMEDLPPAERRYDTTNPTYDLVAATGRAVGFDNFSPLEAENLVRGVTSQATPFITAAVDPLATRLLGRGAQSRLSPPFLQQPLNPASALVAKNPPPSTETEQDYYALKTKVGQAENFLSQAAAAGQMSAAPRLQAYKKYLNPDLSAGIAATDEVLKDLRDEESAVREMFQTKEITPQVARTELDRIKSQRQLVYRRAMTIFADLQ
jgi:hypothetical protein